MDGDIIVYGPKLILAGSPNCRTWDNNPQECPSSKGTVHIQHTHNRVKFQQFYYLQKINNGKKTKVSPILKNVTRATVPKLLFIKTRAFATTLFYVPPPKCNNKSNTQL